MQVTSYFPIWFFPCLMIFYRLWKRSDRGPSPSEMDLVSGSRDEQGFADPEQPEPKGVGRRVLAYVL